MTSRVTIKRPFCRRGTHMKISISSLSDAGREKTVVCEQNDFQPEAPENDARILESAENFALRNVVLGYLDTAFGISSQDVISGDGRVLTRILRCSGRNVRYRTDENGHLVKEKDESNPDRVFEIVVTK